MDLCGINVKETKRSASTAKLNRENSYKNYDSVYAIKKPIVYLVSFLLIALPITVGLLVLHLMPKCDRNNNSGDLGGTQGVTRNNSIAETTVSTILSTSEPWDNLRLSRDVLPVHYDITLHPDIYNGHSWFYGNETIEIKVHKTTTFILIHYRYLNITKTVLKDLNNNVISIKTPRGYEENQFWIIETENALEAGSTVHLELQFDGSLSRATVGFYKGSYVNSITNETRYFAASKFEPVSARRAFPCFDEPNIKANFTVHLVHKNDYFALSNMPVRKTMLWTDNSTLDITDFQTSVKMSTYLVCFIVCDFKYLSRKTKHNIEVRTYATPDKVKQTEFGLGLAVHTMELYEDLFNVSYPLPKQDMIAIPEFVSGAMEHWGLITYREDYMLYDPKEASSAGLQSVANVIAHEVSHQWFGNIVTMDWWDDLWLNEGFANFIQYIGVDSYKPSWKMPQRFFSRTTCRVMITDAKVSSHPIIVNVQNPNQINEVFDSISYNKGASIIRMLESIMGEDLFFTGVSTYLKKYKWTNVKTDDLWKMLGELETGLSVKEVMETWTRQMGLPYLNITLTNNGGSTTVKVVQKRFLADISTPYDENESPFRYRWHIYLDYFTNDGTSGHMWLKKDDEKTFTIPSDIRNGWIKFNVNQTGFYRVLYPDDIWQTFTDQLLVNPPMISSVDKAGLIDDAFNLARGGYLRYDVALNLTLYLDKELQQVPWQNAYSAFTYITYMFEFGGGFSNWRKYILSKVNPVLEQIGWDDNGDHLQKLLRRNIIDLACKLGDKKCLENASAKLRNWKDNNASLPPNLRLLVYKYGLQQSDSVDDWNHMWNKFRTETVPQERVILLKGLSKTRSVWLLMRYLDFCKDKNKIRSQYLFKVVKYISRNPVGRSLVWDWLRSNWEYLIDRFTMFSRSLSKIVPKVVVNFNTEFQLKQVESFFAKYPDAGSGAGRRAQALEGIRGNIAWMKKYQNVILNWLCRTNNNC